MSEAEWAEAVPAAIRDDALWRVKAYRLALFLADRSWAVGSVSANIAEGYSRGTGRDRARFYEYALGSARESRDWYYKGRHVLEETVVTQRLDTLVEIIRLLLTMVPDQRGHAVHEEPATYEV